jgi:hypothetical protein
MALDFMTLLNGEMISTVQIGVDDHCEIMKIVTANNLTQLIRAEDYYGETIDYSRDDLRAMKVELAFLEKQVGLTNEQGKFVRSLDSAIDSVVKNGYQLSLRPD